MPLLYNRIAGGGRLSRSASKMSAQRSAIARTSAGGIAGSLLASCRGTGVRSTGSRRALPPSTTVSVGRSIGTGVLITQSPFHVEKGATRCPFEFVERPVRADLSTPEEIHDPRRTGLRHARVGTGPRSKRPCGGRPCHPRMTDHEKIFVSRVVTGEGGTTHVFLSPLETGLTG